MQELQLKGRQCCRPIQHHRRRQPRRHIKFFTFSLCVCVFFFSIRDCDWRLFAVSVGTPAGRSSTSRLGKFFSGILWGIPFLFSRFSSFSLCLLLFSLTDLLLLSIWLLYFWHLCWLARSTALVWWVVDGFCLDWKFCSVVSEKEGGGRGDLGVACGNAKEIKCCRPCRHSLISGAC